MVRPTLMGTKNLYETGSNPFLKKKLELYTVVVLLHQ